MKLIKAPAAQTHNSIAVVWEKPEDFRMIEAYQLFINGKEAARVKETDYTFENLEPDTEYSIRLSAIMKNGYKPQSNLIKIKTKRQPEVFDVTAYGAVGDGETMNTKAIQGAIDACSEYGMVYIPKGSFKSGALFLKSKMTLYIDEGGILQGSDEPEDYPVISYRYEGIEQLCHASLMNAGLHGNRECDITLEGRGSIDGSGSRLLKAELTEGTAKRGNLICLCNTDNIYMKDITVRQAPFWCVHMIYCSHISMNKVTIQSKYDENGNLYEHIFNGDGFDPDSCSNLFVFHSFISSQDDCIAVKSGKNKEGRDMGIPSENIRITNCKFKSGFGVAMGSEMSGGIRNVFVQDCIFEDTFSIASIKAPRGRGGFIEDIFYDNCHLVNHDRTIKSTKWFKGAVYLDCFYGEDEYDPQKMMPIDEETSAIWNIKFRDIFIETKEGHAIYIVGLPEKPAGNILLENVNAKGEKGLFAMNVEGLHMKNVKVEAAEGDDICMKNAKNVTII